MISKIFKYLNLTLSEVLAVNYLFFGVSILISANFEEDWSINAPILELSFVACCDNSAAQVHALSSIRIQLPSILLYIFYCTVFVILRTILIFCLESCD